MSTETRSDLRSPIDRDIVHDICGSKTGPFIMDWDLRAIQHVIQDDPYDIEGVGATYRTDDRLYLVGTSQSFYDIALRTWRAHDVIIGVDDIREISEAHTRQFIRDRYGHNVSFDNEQSIVSSQTSIAQAFDGDFMPQDVEDSDLFLEPDRRGIVVIVE